MPAFFLILATLLWGVGYVFIKIALQEMPPITFIFLRFFAASVCFLPVMVFVRPKFQRLDLIRGTKLGLLLGGITFFQTIGMQTVTASVSAFLTGFAVVFVLAIKLIGQRKAPLLSDILTVAICIMGLGLVTGSHGITWGAGVYHTLVCALFVALHIVALSKYAATGNILVLTFLQLVVLTILSAVFSVVLEYPVLLPVETITWGAIVLCGVFSSALTFAIQTYAQQYLTASKAAAILTLEPVFASFFASLALNEILLPQFYVGVCLIMATILLMNVRIERIN
jgi:drug/metabolite transporter (DMT)-like permease